jgi:hypothetical protein
VDDVRVEQDCAQGRFQVAPVVNSSSSTAVDRAMPVRLPLIDFGPLAGTSRATT